MRRSGERGWSALARSFPAQRPHSDPPNLDILPPPVAPPRHEPPAPAPEPARPPVAAFVDQRREGERPPAEGAVATLTRPARPAGPVQPMVVRYPIHARVKAGLGLILYVAIAGAALAVIVLLVTGLIARVAGQI